MPATCGKCKATGVSVAHVKECYGIKQYDMSRLYEPDVPSTVAPNDATWSGPGYPEDSWPDEVPKEEQAQKADYEFEVSYDDKDQFKNEMKALGLWAKWDREKKLWFATLTEAEYDSVSPEWKRLTVELVDGIYRHNSIDEGTEDFTYYMVYHTVHGANEQVAKKLNLDAEQTMLDPSEVEGPLGEWAYMGKSPLKILAPEMLLSEEEAAQFGQVYGWCGRCGRVLTNEESKKAGIGPVCASK